MKRFLCVLSGLAIIAAATTANAQIDWAAGAPGGTSGGSIEVGGESGVSLDTGISATLVGGDLTAPVDYTISAWINTRRDNGFGEAADDNWWFGSGMQGIHLGIFDTSKLRVGHWGADQSGTTVVPANTWVHATHSFDADGGTLGTGESKIYFNGVLETTIDNLAPNDSSTNLIIGSRNGGVGPSWDGFIDDVAIFTTQLSDADVMTLAGDSSQAVALGAAAYYDFEDDQTGTTAANAGTLGDSALTGIGAALPPIASWDVGAPGGTPGGSVNFDGSGGLATGIAAALVGGDTIIGGSDYTVSAWINSSLEDATGNGNAAGERWFFGTGFQGLHLGIQEGNSLRHAHWNTDNSGTTAVQVDTWVHATFTFDADGGTGGTTGLQTIYLNGAFEGSFDALAPNESQSDLQIGSRDGPNGPGWIGLVDDVAIFTSALSAQDVAALASNTTQAVSLGAVAYYDFEDDQTGTTAANLVPVSASGLTGTDGSPALQQLDRIGPAMVGGPALKGDVDLDGGVTFLDIQPFINVLSTNSFQAEADCDCDGDVDFLDIQPFINILAGQP